MLLTAELISGSALLAAPAPRTVLVPSPAPASPAALIVGDQRTVEMINLGGPSAAALLARIGATIGSTVESVEAFWGTDWSHRITVTATGTDRQFAALASGDAGGGDVAQWSDVAAVAVADHVDHERREVTGQQVVFAPGAADMSTTSLRIVLTHELFHYAARIDTAADAPRWLTEGVADYVARAATPADAPPFPMTLPSDADLTAAGARRAAAYDRAWWFARYVDDRHGADSLRRLYLAACGPGHGDVATAIQRVLGRALPDVVADWQRWADSLRRPIG